MTVLELDQVTKSFRTGGAQVTAIDHVDLAVETGELVIVMGPSGSGKTTLLQLIGAMLSPTSGSVRVAERDLGAASRTELTDLRLRRIGFIFQSFNLLDALDATGNIVVPAVLAGTPRRRRLRRAHELLEQLELEHRSTHRPAELSGGEKQRVAIARALVNDPDLILADEPTANLDAASGYQVLHLLQDIATGTGKTVIAVTHDHRITAAADRLLWLADGVLHDRQADFAMSTDPVCGMEIVIERAAATRDYEGRRLWFCSRVCVHKFDANPHFWGASTTTP